MSLNGLHSHLVVTTYMIKVCRMKSYMSPFGISDEFELIT